MGITLFPMRVWTRSACAVAVAVATQYVQLSYEMACPRAGGVLVFAGQGCTVELINCTLSQTTLVATAGATVALNRCQFTGSSTKGQGICLIASGTRTTVKTRECWVAGGLVGAAVHQGAHLETKQTMFTGGEIIGIEVKGAGSRLSMSENCRIHDMGKAYRVSNATTKGYWCRAVYAHAAASISLRGVTVKDAEWGIHVRGATAQVHDCSVSQCTDVCMRVSKGSHVVVARSVLDQSNRDGLWASDQGTKVELTACSLLKNRGSGCRADEEASVQAAQCLTGQNECGFFCTNKGRMLLRQTGMNADVTGCRVQGAGSQITAEAAVVWDCTGVGFCLMQGGTMWLRACTALRCGCSGVQANDQGSRLNMQGGQLEGNAQCGVVVCLCEWECMMPNVALLHLEDRRSYIHKIAYC
jgi:Right handed beta helix region